MEKALRFAIDVLTRGDVDSHVESSPALRNHDLYQSEHAAEWHIRYHPVDYVGLIWIALQTDAVKAGQDHHITIIWGDFVFETSLKLSMTPVYLLHHKLEKDALPLYIHAEPEAIVSIGHAE